jgi:hypothetical protein
VLKTLLFVYVLPSIVMWFVQLMLYAMIGVFGGTTGRVHFWIPSLVAGLLAVVIDVVFIVLAWRKVMSNFRETVARAAGLAIFKRKLPTPPPPPPPMPLPPQLPAPPPLVRA